MRGRVVLDVYLWMLNNFRLDEYKLDSVCKAFLGGMTKEDLHFTEITPKWQAGPHGRRELGIYCLKDAELPLALIQALSLLFNAVERARVTGLPLEWVLNRGILIRFTSQLMRESMAKGYLLPHVDQNSPLRQHTTKFAGATVLPVQRGIWRLVAVLDFSSMYPSQIIAENLCYSTFCPGKPSSTFALKASPLLFQGHCFVSASDRKGIIPCILERMLEQRKIAKLAYAQETDPIKKTIQKSREMSYKLACNGFYGALGSRNALIPHRAIAETTTGLGRKDIGRVKAIAESLFTIEKGYPGDAKVVCGDTDSVFVSMPTRAIEGLEAVQEAIQMAHVLADAVNQEMRKPKKIEFEKVYDKILLMMKKRYVSLPLLQQGSSS